MKLEQSLVISIGSRWYDAALVGAMVALGHDLGFRVVMVGVETESVLATVRDMECDEVQGYHISEPRPAAQVAGWLRRHAAGAGR